MSKVRIAINGFGRIGRLSARMMAGNPNIDIVAINDLTDPKMLAHLFKYDTAHGQFDGSIKLEGNDLVINGDKIKVFKERDPSNLPWGELGIDIVLESTGIFRDEEGAGKHIAAGAKKVVISAPAKGNIKTIVLGVNDEELSADDKIVSNASCTTNCLAPMAKILDDKFGIEYGLMTTIHAYTADQNLQDSPHSDPRRARAAAQNIVPTSTGAAAAVGKVLPHLNGKLNGAAMRVPTITGSITEFNCMVREDVTVEAVNNAFRDAGSNAMKGVLQYSTEPLVSSDIVGNPHSNVFDADLTMVMNKMVRVVGWYDNEAGYSARIADLILRMADMAVPA
ncbi:MAG: type I glyceraldehyde-3-phosphate dehydrogenase [Bacteroidia bacterium]|nr:type I glyceraldehyde-3-phosphate dehydrogenase [Bacteroidia bacterium]